MLILTSLLPYSSIVWPLLESGGVRDGRWEGEDRSEGVDPRGGT